MKRVVLLAVMALLGGCTLEYDHDPCPSCGPIYDDTEYIETSIALDEPDYYEYAPGCYEDPYYYSPEWCDYYDDGSTCCVWVSDGWYEEYCQWGNDWCWEYNGSW